MSLTPTKKQEKIRCFGGGEGHELYAEYHDAEWGVPVYDDGRLFEMLILEGAQAGLNWETVLKKRAGYRAVFHQFDPQLVAGMSDQALNDLTTDARIIRHRLKIRSARRNAQVVLAIQEEVGSFASYLWRFVDGQPIINHWSALDKVPTKTPISVALAKDLKQRGMGFVGSTIMYAFMQAIGMVNDHTVSCWRYGQPLES